MSGPGGLRIRPAEPRDLGALVRLEEAVFPTDRLTRRDFRHALRSATIDMLVAESGDAVAGYVQIHRRRGATLAHLATIAVEPDQHGGGVGRALADAAETVARAAGCDRLRLEVRADNARAIRLYEAAGYAGIGRVDDYYEDGSAARRFEKALG